MGMLYNKNMRKLFSGFGVILILAGVFIYLSRAKKGEIADKAADFISKFTVSSGDPFSRDFEGKCQNKEVKFTHTPLAIDKIGYILPMGNMGDAHVTPTDHGYIYPIDQNVPPGTYDIVSPADGEIVRVEAMPSFHVGDRSNNWIRPPEDNRIIIRFSCRYYAIFIHVNELAPKIKAAIGKLEPGENTGKVVPVKAGETIAKLGGNGFDWSMNDAEYTLPGFIQPKLYETEPWKIHTIDAFSLYSEDIRKELEALTPRSADPIFGKIDYDLPGRAIGNWFREGTGGFSAEGGTRFWDGHLAIAPDSIDAKTIIISMGNWKGEAAQFRAEGNFDPASVSETSGAVKVELLGTTYEYIQIDGKEWNRSRKPSKPLLMRPAAGPVLGTIMLQVLPGEKLKFEKFPDKTASEIAGFTPKAQIFER